MPRFSRVKPREGFSDYVHSAALISQHPSVSRCDAIGELVNVDWYERKYFPKQPNISLARNKKLPGEMLGLVIRRDIPWQGGVRGLFLIQVATIRNLFAEQFVIAHELGHVLAHGRLMYAGMVVVESSWEASDEEDVRRRLVELEANIYALLSVVPAPAIEALRHVLHCDVSAAALQQAMQWLVGDRFDLRLARERLLLHQTLTGTVTAAQYDQLLGGGQRSWTLHGAAAENAENMASAPQALSAEQFFAWLRLLCERRILNLNYWPAARRMLQSSAPLRLPLEAARQC